VSIGNMHPIQAKETGGTTPERKKMAFQPGSLTWCMHFK